MCPRPPLPSLPLPRPPQGSMWTLPTRSFQSSDKEATQGQALVIRAACLGRREASWRKQPWSRGLRGGGHTQRDPRGWGYRGMEWSHPGSPRVRWPEQVGPAVSPGQIGHLLRMRQLNVHFRKNSLALCREKRGGGGMWSSAPEQGGSGRTGPEPSRVWARGSSTQPLGCHMCLVGIAQTQQKVQATNTGLG